MALRVTTTPDAADTRSAGIRETSASPTSSEGLAGLGDVHSSGDPEHEAADEVDAGDEEAGDGVAVHELARAIHGAEEVGFALEVPSADLGLLGRERSGRQIRVDRHLLAGHRVQREARGDLGDAAGTLGDDDEVDDDEDQEDDQADEHVAFDDEATEGFDDRASRALALRTVQQDEARRRHVQAEAEKRGDENEGRKRAELERFLDEEGREEDAHTERDREREKNVEERRRNRHHHHEDDADDAERNDGVTTLGFFGGGRDRAHAS
ncbi:MAG: hypothetical protein U0235_14925 [Polyangiaceae bacterium]